MFAFKRMQAHVISPIAWYLGEMVVGWCKTSISASNSQYACGFNRGDTMTMPFLIEERLIWRREKCCNEQQECFPQTYTICGGIYMQIQSLPAGGAFRVGQMEVSPVTAVHKAALCSQTLLYQALHARWNKNDIWHFLKTVDFLQK